MDRKIIVGLHAVTLGIILVMGVFFWRLDIGFALAFALVILLTNGFFLYLFHHKTHEHIITLNTEVKKKNAIISSKEALEDKVVHQTPTGLV
ncbi:MAG: hypothetical protein ACOCSM_00470, partial [Bacillota bacterium]